MGMLTSQTLAGTLDVLGVAEILQLFSSGQKTGVLRLTPKNQQLELKLALREGRLVGVSGRSVPKLADVLLKFGVPAQTVGELGFAMSQGKNLQLIQVLGQEKLEQCLRWRAEVGLFYLWDTNQGEFEFITGEPVGAFELSLNLEPIMLEVARRTDELTQIQLPDLVPEAVYNIAERVGDFSSSLRGLMPIHWNILNAIDGNTSLAEVGVHAVLGWDELVAHIIHLEQVGLIEPRAAQRGVQRSYSRLKIGELSPAFTLPSLDGSNVSLGSLRGKKTLLAFFRHAGCPFCNLRVHQLIESYPRLERLGVQVIGVFGSSVKSLRARVGQQRPPFPLLADPDDAIHTLYGTNRSLLGFLASFSPTGIGNFLEGQKLGIAHGSPDGEATRMPADFLIGKDLRIEAALYGGNASEHISIKALEQWGQQ